MTIFLHCNQEYFAQFKASDQKKLHFDAAVKRVMIRHYTGKVIEGWMRWIDLREGMRLWIEKTYNHGRLLLDVREVNQALTWYFILSGKQKSIRFPSCRRSNFSLSEGFFFFTVPISPICISMIMRIQVPAFPYRFLFGQKLCVPSSAIRQENCRQSLSIWLDREGVLATRGSAKYLRWCMPCCSKSSSAPIKGWPSECI